MKCVRCKESEVPVTNSDGDVEFVPVFGSVVIRTDSFIHAGQRVLVRGITPIDHCQNCGVHQDRKVQRRRRRRPIGGKRGRNSGTVGTSKTKS